MKDREKKQRERTEKKQRETEYGIMKKKRQIDCSSSSTFSLFPSLSLCHCLSTIKTEKREKEKRKPEQEEPRKTERTTRRTEREWFSLIVSSF